MEDATITVRQIHIRENDYVNFEDASGKRWNCNVKKYLGDASDGKPVFNPGRKIDIAYNTTEPKPGKKFGSKYINECRPADPPDKPNTWADKEPYDPSRKSGGGNSGGGKKQTDEFRSKDQVNRSHTLHAICVLRQGASMTIDELLGECDIADNWVMGSSLAEHVAEAQQHRQAEPEAYRRQAPEAEYQRRQAPEQEPYRGQPAAEAEPRRRPGPMPVRDEAEPEHRPAAPQVYRRAPEPEQRRPVAQANPQPQQAQQPPLADFLIRKLSEIGAMTPDDLCHLAVQEGYFADGDNVERAVHGTLMNVAKAGFIRQLPNGTFAPATVMDTIRLRRAI